MSEQYLKDFARGVKDFLRDLMRTYPDVSELKVVFACYKVIKLTGKKNVHRVWQEVSSPYLGFIRARDESFISAGNVVLPSGYAFYSAYVPVFRSMWLSMPPQNKDAVWAHLHNLVVLGELCTAANGCV